ncbi:tumor necrosis factor receptor superfamily member 6 [Kryptolebias marmoratus]|uniref:Tumor necrosis factor receptor superfamily member 6 n=1 Tax=Kryptolebias marmoratus TaxID=37003 RepID=A0A3Q3BBD2_KRYMA|nr:tumor necrosis factor receptor superfamily member 6 [Kryptolebias marmoratus]
MTALMKISVGFSFFYVIFISSTEIDASLASPKQLIRSRREACPTYQHGDRTCCMCPPGQRVTKDCEVKPNDTKCDFCELGTYLDQPNSQTTCERCTSCDQLNANLEVEETCTSYRNAKCRCKENHYCSPGVEPCKVCQHCDTCGPKEACNSACNKTINVGTIVGIVFGVLLVLAGIVAVLICLKKKQWSKSLHQGSEGSSAKPETQPLKDMDMRPFLPQVAEQLGWSNMKEIALQSGMPAATIESAKLNHPQNSEEWTLELLGKWVEAKGKSAPRELIEMLRKRGKNDTAEKISDILSNGSVEMQV